jgi:hypothetical protein
VTLIASIGIAGYAQRKRIGGIEKKLSAAMVGRVKGDVSGARIGEESGAKATSLQTHAVPTPDLLHRAHDYVERLASATRTIRQAENDQAREQAWRAAMADEAIGAELRRLTTSRAP